MEDTSAMSRHIVFPQAGEVALTERDRGTASPDEAWMSTTLSLISSGTELRCFTGEFAPGTHWADWIKYPMAAGYSLVGRTDEGGRVFLRRAHASEASAPLSDIIPIPGDVPDEVAVWGALAMIGGMGFRAGDIRLVDDVAIIGAGPIGQMVLRWCVAAGARVLVVDPAEPRLAHARAGGAFATVAGTSRDAAGIARSVFGEAPRVAIDATGVEAVFADALRVPRDFGTLVLLGDAGDPSRQTLTSDVIRRGVRIAGAHMNHEDPSADWTQRSIHAHFHDLWRRGKFPLEGLVTHRFRPEECGEAYRLLAARDPLSMGIVFEWT